MSTDSLVGSMMDYLFGHIKTPEERLTEMKESIKQGKRELTHAIRQLDREKDRVMEQICEKAADGATRKVLYPLVMRHTRASHEIVILDATKDKLTACERAISKTNTTQLLTRVVASMTMCMKQMNGARTMQEMTQMMMQFDKESMSMELMQEFIDDRLEDVYADQDEEDETDVAEVLDKILAEQGIKITEELPNTPQDAKNKEKISKNSDSYVELNDTELAERLAKLFPDGK